MFSFQRDDLIGEELAKELAKHERHSQQWWQVRVGFKYAPEWYDWYYRETWINRTNSADDLEKDILKDGDNNLSRFKGIKLFGRGLELGFCNARSLYYFGKKYKDITMDGIDWVPSLRKMFPFIRQLCPHVCELEIRNCRIINKPDKYYNFITSLDVFEHTNEEDYLCCIGECYRVTKQGGQFFVYFGKMDNASHINRRSDERVISEITEVGFKFAEKKPDSRRGMLVFLKE